MTHVSVIIPWSNRPELVDTLCQNVGEFRKGQAEVIVVNCGGSKHQLTDILNTVAFEGLRAVDIPSRTFNKALALNMGAVRAQAQYIFLLDADIFLGPNFLANAFAQVDQTCFITPEWVTESDAATTSSKLLTFIQHSTLSLQDGRIIEFEQDRRRFADGSRGGPGEVLVLRQHFLDVGGMNSKLLYWGWEDLDLHVRLRALLHLDRLCLGQVFHRTHGDEKRALLRANRMASSEFNLAAAYERYTQGNFLGTLREDQAKWNEATAEIAARSGRRALDSESNCPELLPQERNGQ
jgi:GT2 family glycosyltransferase